MAVQERLEQSPAAEPTNEADSTTDSEPAKPDPERTFTFRRKGATGIPNHPAEVLKGLLNLKVKLEGNWDGDLEAGRVLIPISRLIEAIVHAKESAKKRKRRNELGVAELHWQKVRQRYGADHEPNLSFLITDGRLHPPLEEVEEEPPKS